MLVVDMGTQRANPIGGEYSIVHNSCFLSRAFAKLFRYLVAVNLVLRK